MAVIFGTDEDLRSLTYAHPYVAVKYHNETFPICKELYPKYKKFSEDKKYKNITFVRVDADENPIAKKLIQKDVYSFMAIYKKGLLMESHIISSEKDIKLMLDKLLTYIDKPQAAN